jgi:hypothetical protein
MIDAGTGYLLLLAVVVTFFVARWVGNRLIDAWAARSVRRERAQWRRRTWRPHDA